MGAWTKASEARTKAVPLLFIPTPNMSARHCAVLACRIRASHHPDKKSIAHRRAPKIKAVDKKPQSGDTKTWGRAMEAVV